MPSKFEHTCAYRTVHCSKTAARTFVKLHAGSLLSQGTIRLGRGCLQARQVLHLHHHQLNFKFRWTWRRPTTVTTRVGLPISQFFLLQNQRQVGNFLGIAFSDENKNVKHAFISSGCFSNDIYTDLYCHHHQTTSFMYSNRPLVRVAWP